MADGSHHRRTFRHRCSPASRDFAPRTASAERLAGTHTDKYRWSVRAGGAAAAGRMQRTGGGDKQGTVAPPTAVGRGQWRHLLRRRRLEGEGERQRNGTASASQRPESERQRAASRAQKASRSGQTGHKTGLYTSQTRPVNTRSPSVVISDQSHRVTSQHKQMQYIQYDITA